MAQIFYHIWPTVIFRILKVFCPDNIFIILLIFVFLQGRGSGFPGRRRSRGGGVGGGRGARGRSRLKTQDSLTVFPGVRTHTRTHTHMFSIIKSICWRANAAWLKHVGHFLDAFYIHGVYGLIHSCSYLVVFSRSNHIIFMIKFLLV